MKWLLNLFLILISSCLYAQKISLEEKLCSHFSGLPIHQNKYDILSFLDSNKMYGYYKENDSVTNEINRISIYITDSTYALRYSNLSVGYFKDVFQQINDTFCLKTSVWTSSFYARTNWQAKKSCKKLVRQYSGYFVKKTKYKGKGLMGSKWKSYYFYKKDNTDLPFIEFSHHNSFDLFRSGYSITIFTYEKILIEKCSDGRF